MFWPKDFKSVTALVPSLPWIGLHLADDVAFFSGVEARDHIDERVEVEDGEVGGAGDEGDYDEQGFGGEFVVYAPEGLGGCFLVNQVFFFFPVSFPGGSGGEDRGEVTIFTNKKKDAGLGGSRQKGAEDGQLTVQKDRGRKKMLTNAKSLTFSPSLVDALLSITALALNSCEKNPNISHFRQGAL